MIVKPRLAERKGAQKNVRRKERKCNVKPKGRIRSKNEKVTGTTALNDEVDVFILL